MDITLTPSPSSLLIAALRLPRGGTFSWRVARGSHVEVHTGRVWLTCSGVDGDDFVAAGQALPLDGVGTVVIECDSAEPAQLSIVQPRRSWSLRLLDGLVGGGINLQYGLQGLSQQRLQDIGATTATLRAATLADALERARRERVLQGASS